MRLRNIFVIGATLSLLGIGVPAWSEDDPKSCTELLSADTPAYVVCHWMATEEEARDIALFWGANDGENMKETTPLDREVVDCNAAGNSCPGDLEGDGAMHGDGDPEPDGYVDDGGTPECDPGTECAVKPEALKASAEDIKGAAQTPQGQALSKAAESGLRVWIDTDLTDDWKAGKLAEAVKAVGALAAQPGVAGIRFATQLGYDQTFTTAEEIDKFVAETSAALRIAAPGKKLAAHTLVPLFGCGVNDACKVEMTKKYPLLDPERIGAFLTKGQIDQLALDAGLLATEYATWKIDATEAQRNQWIQVRAKAWDAYAQIAAEDAVLTAPGSSQLTAVQARKTLTERVATPLQNDAAETVTLWTRWQDPNGTVNRVLGEKLATNATWQQLDRLDSVKPRLATVYDPATPEVDTATDLQKLAEVFGQVYLTTA
ncbi:hypothetical protein [Nonomuraea sp. NPDC046570]|uniref:hypothetical protein n=1 Tax=Nonomuraea sp. NPDC046570 TaxID=3155255 RepID=UPI00340EF6E4